MNKLLLLASLFVTSLFARAADPDVLRGIAAGDTTMIRTAGISCDQAYVPVLRKQSASFPKNSAPRRWIRASLARLGDESSFRLIQEDLRSKKPLVVQDALLDLKFVGGIKAAGVLRDIILSSEKRFSLGTTVEGDMEILPYNDTASWALWELLKNPPKDRVELLRMHEDGRLAFWREWLSAHRLQDEVKEGCSAPEQLQRSKG